MIKMDNLVYIGHVAVFYLPAEKLKIKNNDGKLLKEILHEYLIKNYGAYTFDIGKTKGYWVGKKCGQLITDINARYEVSFYGKEYIQEFVNFLSNICRMMGEEAIYTDAA